MEWSERDELERGLASQSVTQRRDGGRREPFGRAPQGRVTPTTHREHHADASKELGIDVERKGKVKSQQQLRLQTAKHPARSSPRRRQGTLVEVGNSALVVDHRVRRVKEEREADRDRHPRDRLA